MSWCLSPDLLETISITKVNTNKFQINNSFIGSDRQANPEEIIRQLMISRLVKHYHFNPKLLQIEFPIQMGSTKKRADIVVFNDENQPLVIVEVKVHITTSSINQLHSYLQATPAKYGILVDAQSSNFYKKLEDSRIVEVSDIIINNHNEGSNGSYDVTEKTVYGIDRLIKEIYDNSDEKWLVVINEKSFEISLKELQNYQKVQSLALEAGESLFNHNPSHSEWRSGLHTLILSIEEVKKENPYKTGKEYTFLMDVIEVLTEKQAKISSYFTIRGDGGISFWFNGFYIEYEQYKIQRSEPYIGKKAIIDILKENKTLLERSVVSYINGGRVRVVVLDPLKLPEQFLNFIRD